MTLLIASFFDLEVNGISLIDPEDLTPPNPDAAWLMRETADGWTYDRRIKKAQAGLYRLLEGWVPSDRTRGCATAATLPNCDPRGSPGLARLRRGASGHRPGATGANLRHRRG